MKVELQPGTYVLAISGGVDSVALLDIVAQLPQVKLVVAHVDHGIRDDSHLDRKLVAQLVKQYEIPFVYHEAKLGPGASEDVARRARYAFLRKVKESAQAHAIVTAHHHDDAVETAVLNLIRGTNRRGMSALHANTSVVRPFLHIKKADIIKHAQVNELSWREDSTNVDTRYARNRVRHTVLPKMTAEQRREFEDTIHRFIDLNRSIDTELANVLHMQPHKAKLDRAQFLLLPHIVALEVMATWLRANGLRNYDKKTLERIVIGSKTLLPGKYIDVISGCRIKVTSDALALELRER